MLLNINEAFHLFHRCSSPMQRYVVNMAKDRNEPLLLPAGVVRTASNMHTVETVTSPSDSTTPPVCSEYQYFTAPLFLDRGSGQLAPIHDAPDRDEWLRPLEDAIASMSDFGVAQSNSGDDSPVQQRQQWPHQSNPNIDVMMNNRGNAEENPRENNRLLHEQRVTAQEDDTSVRGEHDHHDHLQNIFNSDVDLHLHRHPNHQGEQQTRVFVDDQPVQHGQQLHDQSNNDQNTDFYLHPLRGHQPEQQRAAPEDDPSVPYDHSHHRNDDYTCNNNMDLHLHRDPRHPLEWQQTTPTAGDVHVGYDQRDHPAGRINNIGQYVHHQQYYQPTAPLCPSSSCRNEGGAYGYDRNFSSNEMGNEEKTDDPANDRGPTSSLSSFPTCSSSSSTRCASGTGIHAVHESIRPSDGANVYPLQSQQPSNPCPTSATENPPRSPRVNTPPDYASSASILPCTAAFQDTPAPPRCTPEWHLPSSRAVVQSHSVFYCGVIATRLFRNPGRSHSLLIGRCLMDPVIGDLFAVMHNEDNTVVIISIRVVGLNRKDKWILVCHSKVLDSLLESNSNSQLLSAVRYASRYTEFRGCPRCGAAAQPNSCFCTPWTTITELSRAPENRRIVFDTKFAGIYYGIARSAAADSDGVLRNLPGILRATSETQWDEDQMSSSQTTLSMLVQRALVSVVPAPLSPVLEEFSLSRSQYRSALSWTAATGSDHNRTGATSTLQSSALPKAHVDCHVRACADPVSETQLALQEKDRKAYERKLRNRDAALRSNLKRSQKYKKLTSDVQDRRTYIEALTATLEKSRNENSRLRHAVGLPARDTNVLLQNEDLHRVQNSRLYDGYGTLD